MAELRVTVCDACREAARGLNMEAGSDPEIGEWPSPYLGVDDLRDIIKPQPHGLHNIDNVRALALLDRLRAISCVE